MEPQQPLNRDALAQKYRSRRERNIRLTELAREIDRRNAALVELQRINNKEIQYFKDEQALLHSLNHRPPGQPDPDERQPATSQSKLP